MTKKRIISTKNAPEAIGPYSQATEKGGMLFISGQIPIDPVSGKVIEGGIEEQTVRVLENIKAILNTAGYTFSEVVKTTCMLSEIKNFKLMNNIYSKYFQENPPARATFAVKELPLDVLIEIDVIAIK